MNILTIPLRNIRRKPSQTILLLLVFSLGVMSIVALYQVSEVVGYSLEKKLTTFGANIVISPATEQLSVSYGGFNMDEMFFEIQDLPEEETVTAIRAIELRDRISAVAPKLVTMAKIKDTAVALVGVRWREEQGIKSYWATDGSFPQILIGSRAAADLGLSRGDKVSILGQDFTVSEGEFVAIVGRSGSGKTTLLNVLSTLVKLDNGDLQYWENDLRSLSDSRLNKLRQADFSVIFQFHHLLPYLTVLENSLLPFMRSMKSGKEEAVNKAWQCLDRVGLADKADWQPR